MKQQGTLVFDERAGRYVIRFGIADYGDELHCGDCFEVFIGCDWFSTRIEYGDYWYLVGVETDNLNGLRVRI